MTTSKILETREELKALFEGTKAIAVVGLSEKPERDSHSIAAYLQSQGYSIVGVHPTAKSILGSDVYPSVAQIPENVRRSIGIVAIFRRSEDVPPILAEVAKVGLRTVWLPLGASSPAAVEASKSLGLTLVADKCLRTVHAAVLPKR